MKRPLCTRPKCRRTRNSGELCDVHFRVEKAAGRVGMCDSTAAKAHVDALIDIGWLRSEIARAAGISNNPVQRLAAGDLTQMRRPIEQAILAVPLESPPLSRRIGIANIGAARRVNALRRIGWPVHEIARRIGASTATLTCILEDRRRISRALHAEIARIYDELSLTPGPSRMSTGRAKARGYPPPLCWDDDTIDDPAAKPQGLPGRYATTRKKEAA